MTLPHNSRQLPGLHRSASAATEATLRLMQTVEPMLQTGGRFHGSGDRFCRVGLAVLGDPAAFFQFVCAPFHPPPPPWACGLSWLWRGSSDTRTPRLQASPRFTPIGLQIVISVEAAAIRLPDRCWLSACAVSGCCYQRLRR